MNVVIFGDSIALGEDAENKKGWAHYLKKFWEERDPQVTLINEAKAGETSAGVLSYAKEICEKYKPEAVIVALGLNDSAYSFSAHQQKVVREKFEQNIEAILNMCAQTAQKIIVLGVLRVDERYSTFSDEHNTVFQYQNIVIQKYNDSLKGLAKNAKATFVSLYELLTDEELDDGYHPNEEGHKKLFEEIKKAL